MEWNRNGYRIKTGFLTAVIVAILILSSCIDDPPTHPQINDYQSYLTLVWELYDQKYVGFDDKNVDWDALHDEYLQLAGDVNSFDELQYLIIEMVGELEDHNAWLLIPFSFVSKTPTYRPDIEMNFNYSLLMELLEPWNFQWNSSMGVMWGHCVIDSIPYFAIKHFDTFFTFTSFSAEFQNHLDAPGMIIDIRMSDGISLVPAKQIPGVFAVQYRTLFFTQYRTGPAHSDLSALYKHTVYPRSWAFTKPVIILTGEQVTGAAEAFVSAVEHIPHVTVIGDTTGGGGNIPGYFNQIYWPIWENISMTCPFARVFTADTVSIEGIGILPDIYVQTTPADFLAGHDPVLEYAIEWIAEETAP
ncbi:MAG: hypothetical protein KAR44_10945 [Candidatus Aegiribacteria sp.]|nr:hypothetical protein [Candidatus Aegiribacteria sp.]